MAYFFTLINHNHSQLQTCFENRMMLAVKVGVLGGEGDWAYLGHVITGLHTVASGVNATHLTLVVTGEEEGGGEGGREADG